MNKPKALRENVQKAMLVEKFLRSMTLKFNYVVCSIEEANDVITLSINELQSSLMVHEQRMQSPKEKERGFNLKVTSVVRNGGRGRGLRGGRGRGRQQINKETIECYHCRKLGYYQYECPI